LETAPEEREPERDFTGLDAALASVCRVRRYELADLGAFAMSSYHSPPSNTIGHTFSAEHSPLIVCREQTFSGLDDGFAAEYRRSTANMGRPDVLRTRKVARDMGGDSGCTRCK